MLCPYHGQKFTLMNYYTVNSFALHFHAYQVFLLLGHKIGDHVCQQERHKRCFALESRSIAKGLLSHTEMAAVSLCNNHHLPCH